MWGIGMAAEELLCNVESGNACVGKTPNVMHF